MVFLKFLVGVFLPVDLAHVFLGQFDRFFLVFRSDDEPAIRCCRLTIEFVLNPTKW